jgi:SAM-dependent methyltransferase
MPAHGFHYFVFPSRLGRTGDVLEIGSGTGQHVVQFAGQSPTITWWPSDHLDSHLRSIDAWRRHEGRDVQAPVRLDASAPDWKLAAHGLPSSFTAMFCANVIHITPWRVTEGIFAGAGRHLSPGGRLVLYGPFRRDGVHNSPGNEAFDADLRRDNPEWGVRDTADLRKLIVAPRTPSSPAVAGRPQPPGGTRGRRIRSHRTTPPTHFHRKGGT